MKRLAAVTVVVLLIAGVAAGLGNPLSGAIFTSGPPVGPSGTTCTGVDLNIYDSKKDVYLDGGPAHPFAAGLPDGDYYVQVTSPEGSLLGTSLGLGDGTPVHVTNGEFDKCYQLWSIVVKASNGLQGYDGYDDTPNQGGEYKVWVSDDPTFANFRTKTDNFKVRRSGGGGGSGGNPPPQTGSLEVIKFYDKNADGRKDDDEIRIEGWKVGIKSSSGQTTYGFTTLNASLPAGIYTVF